MKFHVKFEKDSDSVGCGVPGCGHGCNAPVRLSFSYYVLATSQEDAERYVKSEVWDDNFTFTVEEAGEDGPEMDTFATPSFEAQEFAKAYAEAEAEMKKAQDELYVLVKYAADHQTLQKAMDKWRHWIEECAFLRGG